VTMVEVVNAGFEADWGDEKSHRCLVCLPGGVPYQTDVGNIFTPPGWLTWFRHEPDVWDQPEVRDAWRSGDPRRVHSGEKAMLLFTFYRNHDAGFLQQVQVESGTHLELTAWAHAWSNWHDGAHPDDPRWSDGPGYEAGFALAGTVQDDNWRNFTFYVGIDPTGGVDPFANTVVWGPGAHIYNEHAQVPPVIATASSSTITIFLRSKTLWTFKHNDAYWDDVTLVVTDEPPSPPPSDRGHPRVQYERVFHLLPPGVTREEAHAALDDAFVGRHTIGFSADDAGTGDLDARRVIAYNPDRWPSDLGQFFERYYPGVDYHVRHLGPPDPGPPPPPPLRGNLIGLHLQGMSEGWDDYVRNAGPNVVKVLASMHDVIGVKRVSPETAVVWRHVDNCYDGILDAADPHVGARRWIAKFRDSLYARCEEIARECPGVRLPFFYVESINEVYPSEDAAAVTRAANFDIAFIEELEALGLPVRAVVFTAGIGNPHQSEYELLVPLARAAERHGALMGYHGYFWVDHGESHLDYAWIWHAGRWIEMDKVFVQHGIHVAWFGAENGAHFSCVDGWRAPTCFNGDWDAYEANIVHLRDKIARWNTDHGDRFLGLVLFTTGGPGWASWEIQRPEMERLTAALAR